MRQKKNYAELFLFFCAFLMGVFLLENAGFTNEGDDEVYRTAIETWGSWKNWANAIYEGWSGRVILLSILIALTNLPIIIWKTISAVLVAVTCWMIYRIVTLNTAEAGEKQFLFGVTVIAWRMIPELYTPVIWASGSVNYLYPVAMLMICMYLFYLVLAGRQISNAIRFWGYCVRYMRKYGTSGCGYAGNWGSLLWIYWSMLGKRKASKE